ncbi:MAG: ParB/RepB/Spo0J family partition protein [Gammaproteobacteria bacterium]
MTLKKRSLGKGLDALLGTLPVDVAGTTEDLRNLPVDLIKRGQYQPRKSMNPEALADLADSIRTQGVVQPILVRPLAGQPGKYEIIAGERRWRAAQMAGLQNIPALVREVPDRTAACIALIENIQREDLNPLEEAQTFNRLLEEFSMTHEAVAEAVGRSRSTVTNLLRLLELHPEVQELLRSGHLEMGHARAVAGLGPEQQVEIARRVVKRGLSVREAERLARDAQKPGKKKGARNTPIDPNIRSLQDKLSERLGARATIRHTSRGKGRLEIHYNSLDELDGILARIK